MCCSVEIILIFFLIICCSLFALAVLTYRKVEIPICETFPCLFTDDEGLFACLIDNILIAVYEIVKINVSSTM